MNVGGTYITYKVLPCNLILSAMVFLVYGTRNLHVSFKMWTFSDILFLVFLFLLILMLYIYAGSGGDDTIKRKENGVGGSVPTSIEPKADVKLESNDDVMLSSKKRQRVLPPRSCRKG